jgi:hypothetical protein
MAAPPRAISAQRPGAPGPIADNSFLVEEAYNQERGVVQHISTFTRARRGDRWAYTFTQEWPVGGQRSQVSYAVPVEHRTGAARIGDVSLNYRYQLVAAGSRVAVAPRVTVVAPTGGAAADAGGVGVQMALPVSAIVAPWLVVHANLGAERRSSATAIGIGASAIWRVRPAFNLMLELAGRRSDGRAGRERELYLSPGVRWAHNFASGLQIVPGIAYPVGVGPSRGNDAFLFYVSFEHPFRKGAVS